MIFLFFSIQVGQKPSSLYDPRKYVKHKLNSRSGNYSNCTGSDKETSLALLNAFDALIRTYINISVTTSSSKDTCFQKRY